ncbi:MAG: hypothetical protein K6G45_02190 [Lachnospiraceae bacterium]|nr:hypothetical protein [Lachnospiraceae bacterium]
MTLYDSSGRAVAYCDDGDTIYLFNGIPVAYFFGSRVYGFRGQHLGNISDGWIRDNRGLCVFFTENATGGPLKPIKRLKPIKNVKHVKPVKAVRHVPFLKPADKISWSNLSGERFFLTI